ncbi:purple acid phosphatase 17 [Striga asiatica]|uniref:acid phosphatase n=1 Tax=Striga asiatica TaxID=4170 RepID=A0A5A7QJN8_STRAF|nr:purple acid phosphatase 17 [Striga asiatica]
MACVDKKITMVNLVWFCLAAILLFSYEISAKLHIFEQPTKGDGTVKFLVIGDWGRKGEFNQSQVAFQMGRIGEELDIDFVVSTGDNFYDDGLNGESDPAFVESFTNIYTAKSLQKQWFSVLGNHDYRGDVVAQISSALRKIDHRWLCLRSFVNLESSLKKSRAKWKIVVGHHAIRSVGHHGDTPELITHLLPILQAYNVDFYMNGHDHCLEHISDNTSPIQFLTSGAGSKAWRGDVKSLNEETLKFFYDGQGFMSVQLTENEGEIVFYDVFGRVLHKWAKSKQLHLEM